MDTWEYQYSSYYKPEHPIFTLFRIDNDIDYPMLILDMISSLFAKRCFYKVSNTNIVAQDAIEVVRKTKASPLYWEICAFAWIDIWENDTPVTQALWNAYNDWEK